MFPEILQKYAVDSMESFRRFYGKSSINSTENFHKTVSYQCTHWLNMTETLLFEILFTFDNTIKF